MSLDLAGPGANGAVGASAWRHALTTAIHCVLALLAIAIVVQTLIVVEARPQDLVTGVHGMADIIWRAIPPDFSKLPATFWPTLQTVDIALFGTMVGIVIAIPLALLAGEVRGIPFGWRLIDCSFGILGSIPLLACRRLIAALERARS